MKATLTPRHPLILEAARLVGNQTKLADAIGLKQVSVSYLAYRALRIPEGRAAAIEHATNGRITKAMLCPEITGDAA